MRSVRSARSCRCRAATTGLRRTRATNTPYYYPGGQVGGRPVPSGWYSEPWWKTALVAGAWGIGGALVFDALLAPGFGDYGYGYGGYEQGYDQGFAAGENQGYDQGYDQGQDQAGDQGSDDRAVTATPTAATTTAATTAAVATTGAATERRLPTTADSTAAALTVAALTVAAASTASNRVRESAALNFGAALLRP